MADGRAQNDATDEQFVNVAVEAPLQNLLTYKASADFVRGDSVLVPLGKRTVRAVIMQTNVKKPAAEISVRAVSGRNDDRPRLSEPILKWLEWVSDYYIYPIGQVMALSFAPLKKVAKLRRSSLRAQKKNPIVKSVENRPKPKLTDEQDYVVKNIHVENGFSTHLIFGVTGSGKTEIYFELLEKALQAESDRLGSALVLVPEISLTPQLTARFAARFGDKIAVLHSQLTDRERTEQWWKIVSGEKKILIGARSALFCPIPDLRIIVVDEEHETSYKQEEKLRYHARDAAVMLARHLDIPIVLGSATPSLESWQNAKRGKYHLHTLTRRVAEREMPKIELIDLREVSMATPFWLSPQLESEIRATLDRGEQIALFLNRRGIARAVLCTSCGHNYSCPNCTISLTLHGERDLICHYCDYHELLSDTCPKCKEGELKSIGLGTEQLENDLKKIFPPARIARADRDEIRSRQTLEQFIHQMESHEIDILVGTQMIAKGLDFPKLSLVGLVLADIGFNIPDFRSTERAYQLITQMSGRAGRHQKDGGRVFIQTYNPEHPALQMSLAGQFSDFADHELAAREQFAYPPFCRLAAIRVISRDFRRGENTIEQVARRAEALKKINAQYEKIEILGPVEAPIARLRGQFRFHALFKSRNNLSGFCRQLLGNGAWIPSSTKVQIDIDPMNLL